MFGVGIIGIVNGFMLAITHITFIYSVQLTSVANTLLIVSSAPVFAAILSLIILKENQPPVTWVVIVIAFIAIFIIGYGNYSLGSMSGDVFALCGAISTAFSAVLARYKKDIDLVPSVIIGSIIIVLLALMSAPISTIDTTQLCYLILLGFLVIPLAFVIMTIAPRFTRSAEVQLVYLLESILGPLWVWLVISEIPSVNTIIGGSLLLVSVFWLAVVGIRDPKIKLASQQSPINRS